ncbi:MAG: hypothetical protein WBK91_10075 [Alphaproteobacteria bacterium]
MIQLALMPQRYRPGWRLAKGLIIAVPLACAGLAVWFGQDANWDLRNYHWYNAYAFLNDRHGYDLLPSQTPFFYNPIIDVPLYLLNFLGPARFSGAVLGLVQGLNFIPLFMLCHAMLNLPHPIHRVGAAAALAILGMAGGGGLAQIGTTFYDNVVSIGLLTSLLLLATNLPYLYKHPTRNLLPRVFAYGIPAGLALGLKLTLLPFCAALFPALLLTGGTMRQRLRLGLAFGCGMALGLVVTQGYWMWFLWTQYQNPIFPYFNQIFGSPYAPPTSARDTQFIPGTWLDVLTFPLQFAQNPKLVGEILWRDYRIPALYLLLPICSVIAWVVGRRRDASLAIAPALPTRFLLWFAVFGYIFWLALFSIYRYLVVLEMLAPLLIVLSLGLLPLRRNPKFLAAAGLLLVLAVTVKPGDWGHAPWSAKFVTVLTPSIAAPEQTLLLMGGYEPYSHIIPGLPPEMAVVRFQSNFTDPTKGNTGINAAIRTRIAQHQGAYLMVLPAWQVPHSDHIQIALATYNLRFLAQSCQAYPDNMGNSFAYCPVERIPLKAPDNE